MVVAAHAIRTVSTGTCSVQGFKEGTTLRLNESYRRAIKGFDRRNMQRKGKQSPTPRRKIRFVFLPLFFLDRNDYTDKPCTVRTGPGRERERHAPSSVFLYTGIHGSLVAVET